MGAPDTKDAALLIVDIQPDFLPGGALPVAAGNEILNGVRALMGSSLIELMVATQDWHPPGHVSFASSHEGRAPFEVIDLYGHPQTLWPDHCVRGTPGAELHRDLPWEKVSLIVRKATDPIVDSYSGLRNNWNQAGDRPPTGLRGYLHDRGVKHVFVCGLARDYCVKWTAEDARDDGFGVTVIWDLTRSVDPTDDEEVRRSLQARGVEVVDSKDL